MRPMEILLTLFVCVFASGIAKTAKPEYSFPPEKAKEIVESTLKCLSKLGYDPSLINLLKEGKYAENDQLIEGSLCMMQDIGYGFATGRVDVDKITNDLFLNKPEIRVIMESCGNKYYGKPPMQNLKSFFVCFRDEAPIEVVFKL